MASADRKIIPATIVPDLGHTNAVLRFPSITIAAMPAQNSPHWKAYLALIGGVLILGFSPIFTRLANAPGSVVSFYRMAIGTAMLAIPFASRAGSIRKLPRRGLMLSALAGIFFALDLSIWATGISYAGATIPTLLGNTAPLWVGIGAWLLFHEDLKPVFWFGLSLAMLGGVLVLGLDFSNGLVFNKGAMLGLVGSFFYGSYMLVTQRGRDLLDTLSFFWIAAISSTITLLALCLLTQAPLLGYTKSTYIYFLLLGILVQAAAWMAINYAQGYLPASVASPTLLGQPVLTAILAGPLLSEQFTAIEWLGGAAVVTGIILVHRSRQLKRPVIATV